MRHFIDTSFLFAIASKDDKFHEEAVKWLKSMTNQNNVELITSDYVIDEFLLLLMKYQGMENAIRWSEIIMSGRFCSLYYCSDLIFSLAIDVFQREIDERKPLTLTDAIVFISSKNLSCDGILTYDERLRNYA